MKKIFTLLLVLIGNVAFSQSTFIETLCTAGVPQNLFGKSATDSGYLFYGFNFFTGNNIFAKLDSSGGVTFCKYYNMPSTHLVSNAFESQNGYTLMCSTGSNSIGFIRADQAGNFVSAKTINSSQTIALNLVGQIGTDLYFCGSLNQSSALVKTDTSGTIIWAKQFSTSTSSTIETGVISEDDQLLLTGYTYTGSAQSSFIIKTDTSGSIIWSNDFSSYYDFKTSATKDSGLVLNTIDLVVKINSSGNIEWSNQYSSGPDYTLTGRDIKAAKDSGYIIAGDYTPANMGLPQPAFLMHLNSAGSADWLKTYGTINRHPVGTCDITSDYGYTVTGTTDGFAITASPVAYVIKTDQWGSSDCFDTTASVSSANLPLFTSPISFTTSAVTLTIGNLTVTPVVSDQPTSIVCSQTTDIIENNILDVELYPNPVSDFITIKISNALHEKIKMNICDLHGKNILRKSIYTSETKIDCSNFSNGVYFYSFENAKGIVSGKFIVAH